MQEDDEDADVEGDGAEDGHAVRTGMDVEAGEEAVDEGIPVQEIDAYWLQRKVAKAFGNLDPNQAQKLGEDTFAALQVRVGAGGGLCLCVHARAVVDVDTCIECPARFDSPPPSFCPSSKSMQKDNYPPHPPPQTPQLPDAREVENRLVMLLDFDKFDLIKELLANRQRIVWCMRLTRAEDEAERQRIENEMAG